MEIKLPSNWDKMSEQEQAEFNNKREIRFNELEQASLPLQAYLQKYHNMESIVIVEIGGVKVYSGEIGMPLEFDD